MFNVDIVQRYKSDRIWNDVSNSTRENQWLLKVANNLEKSFENLMKQRQFLVNNNS